MNTIKSIAIVGGGTAGWMTAAALSRVLLPENVSIKLIESEQIGTVGVGEATIPDIANFNRMLGIDERAFMSATKATFKLGIQFNDWGKLGDCYFHPFGQHGVDMNGIDFHQYFLHVSKSEHANTIEHYSLCALAARSNKFALPSSDPRSVLSQMRYAYHFDAAEYAAFLRRYAEQNGVIRIEGKIKTVATNIETGDITAVTLDNDQSIDADFFFDCSGFKSLLLDKALGVEYRDWSHWLPCNSAQAMPSKQASEWLPYTKSTAKNAGWQWRIPTQQRVGNGHIYCNHYMNDDQARQVLLEGLDTEPLAEPRIIRFQTGCRNRFWEKNCVGVGLSSGFLEPLESTSIYLIQQSICRFLALYPTKQVSEVIRGEYNRLMTREFEQVRDFIILHYKVTQRTDSEFWNYCRNMSIPDSLQHKIDLFQQAGRVFRDEDELFTKPSWVAVMMGQNIIPDVSDPILCGVSESDIQQSLSSMHSAMKNAVNQMPSHAQFIAKYAPCNLAGNDSLSSNHSQANIREKMVSM